MYYSWIATPIQILVAFLMVCLVIFESPRAIANTPIWSKWIKGKRNAAVQFFIVSGGLILFGCSMGGFPPIITILMSSGMLSCFSATWAVIARKHPRDLKIALSVFSASILTLITVLTFFDANLKKATDGIEKNAKPIPYIRVL